MVRVKGKIKPKRRRVLIVVEAGRHLCAHCDRGPSVGLILQPAEGEIEILHEAWIPTGEASGGA